MFLYPYPHTYTTMPYNTPKTIPIYSISISIIYTIPTFYTVTWLIVMTLLPSHLSPGFSVMGVVDTTGSMHTMVL